VLLAAADTFRAAAVQQLEMWGTRVGVPVHKGKDGAKPSAVVYEAVQRGVAEGFDVVIADTAGRLQNKAPLMEELRKIRDACGKACPGAPHEVLLVLDATTGQNAISQAKEFSRGPRRDRRGAHQARRHGQGRRDPRGGREFKLPVRFIGVGEKSDDLREFDAATSSRRCSPAMTKACAAPRCKHKKGRAGPDLHCDARRARDIVRPHFDEFPCDFNTWASVAA
jgi:fused signal recognition particle receptor